MKKQLYILFLSIFLTACSSKSSIITSKNEAIKKQVYKKPIPKTAVIHKKTREPAATIVEKQESKQELKQEIPIQKSDSVYVYNSKDDSYLSYQLVDKILEFIGTRYQTGGTSKSGFDCSGLMYTTFGFFDIKLPRTSNDMSRTGIKIDPKDAKKGDLIFFKTLGNKKINHVGMVIEANEDEIKFVHASIKRGVIVSTTKEGYYKNTFAQVNRVLD